MVTATRGKHVAAATEIGAFMVEQPWGQQLCHDFVMPCDDAPGYVVPCAASCRVLVRHAWLCWAILRRGYTLEVALGEGFKCRQPSG